MQTQVKRVVLITSFLLYSWISEAQWRLFISNDVCMDYTWCLTEQQLKSSMADLIAAHLDVMALTDDQSWQNRARYTCTATNEIFFFLEKYPERKDELVKRLREGRIILSPFLVNTMWGFAGSEGFLRAMYPAKRFAAKNDVPLDHAVHSELPSMPWDIVPLLSGSGIRWINKAFLNYDATFAGLKNPPLFIWKGPGDSKIFAMLDAVASLKFAYMQGGGVLKLPPYEKDTTTVRSFWLLHSKDSKNYPLEAVLAEGTHCDLSTSSAAQASSVARKIIDYNDTGNNKIMMVNSTFTMFTDYVDSVQASSHFMKEVEGSFGHSWELWPLGLAKYAVDLRRGENALVAAESLLSASRDIPADTSVWEVHNRAEWLLGMLQDHAWNGCNPENISLNASIRKRFSEELILVTDTLMHAGFIKSGLKNDAGKITVFNPTAFPREDIVEIPVNGSDESLQVKNGRRRQASQIIDREGGRTVSFKTGIVPPYGFVTYSTINSHSKPSKVNLDGAGFRLSLRDSCSLDIFGKDPDKLIVSLQLVRITGGTRYQVPAIFDKPRIISQGEVGEYYSVSGRLPFASVRMEIQIAGGKEPVRLSVIIHKEKCISEEGIYLLCNLPFMPWLEAETTAAVTRPYMSYRGDMLPGADTSRMVIQGFVNAVRDGGEGLLLASPDAFCLLPSTKTIIVELLGNNQNYREAIKDQNGEENFDFRFGILPYAGKPDLTTAWRFGRSFQLPLAVMPGKIDKERDQGPVSVTNAEVTCLKPADPAFGKGLIIRLRNFNAEDRVAEISCSGFSRATMTDLLEQDLEPLVVQNGRVRLPVRAKGLASVRIEY